MLRLLSDEDFKGNVVSEVRRVARLEEKVWNSVPEAAARVAAPPDEKGEPES